jgi:hypothetical protein
MKTHAEAKKHTSSRANAAPVPNALSHQAQLRGALLRAGVQPKLEAGAAAESPNAAETAAAGQSPDMTGYLVPPGEWSNEELEDFKSFEKGETLQWNKCKPELLAARDNLVKNYFKVRRWKIDYTSAYRPLIYQAHFHDIKLGDRSKTEEGKAHAAKHKLAGVVARPNANSPHVRGVAFDATVTDMTGRRLNTNDSTDAKTKTKIKGTVDGTLQIFAKRCGLDVNIPGDFVHFQLGAAANYPDKIVGWNVQTEEKGQTGAKNP